jgi:hypothetical protein
MKTPREQSNSIKLSYDSPRLNIYGDIREVTKAVDISGKNDVGGSAMMTKT